MNEVRPLSWIGIAREVYCDMSNPEHIRNLLYTELVSNIKRKIISDLKWENVRIDEGVISLGYTDHLGRWCEHQRITLSKRQIELLRLWAGCVEGMAVVYNAKPSDYVFVSLHRPRERFYHISNSEESYIRQHAIDIVRERTLAEETAVEESRKAKRRAEYPRIAELEQEIERLQQTLSQLELELAELYYPKSQVLDLPSDGDVVPIEVLDLSVRVFNSLKRTGIKTIADAQFMLDRGPDAMLEIRNFGKKAFDELEHRLELYYLQRGQS